MSAKKKFNIIDILAILVVIAVIAAVAFVVGGKPQVTQPKSKSVILEVKEKTESFCKVPQSGDILWHSDTKAEIGKVISKEIKPAYGDINSMEEGVILSSPIPDKYNLYLTVEVYGLDSEPKVGTAMNIQGRKYMCTGYVVEIPQSEEVAK